MGDDGMYSNDLFDYICSAIRTVLSRNSAHINVEEACAPHTGAARLSVLLQSVRQVLQADSELSERIESLVEQRTSFKGSITLDRITLDTDGRGLYFSSFNEGAQWFILACKPAPETPIIRPWDFDFSTGSWEVVASHSKPEALVEIVQSIASKPINLREWKEVISIISPQDTPAVAPSVPTEATPAHVPPPLHIPITDPPAPLSSDGHLNPPTSSSTPRTKRKGRRSKMEVEAIRRQQYEEKMKRKMEEDAALEKMVQEEAQLAGGRRRRGAAVKFLRKMREEGDPAKGSQPGAEEEEEEEEEVGPRKRRRRELDEEEDPEVDLDNIDSDKGEPNSDSEQDSDMDPDEADESFKRRRRRKKRRAPVVNVDPGMGPDATRVMRPTGAVVMNKPVLQPAMANGVMQAQMMAQPQYTPAPQVQVQGVPPQYANPMQGVQMMGYNPMMMAQQPMMQHPQQNNLALLQNPLHIQQMLLAQQQQQQQVQQQQLQYQWMQQLQAQQLQMSNLQAMQFPKQ